MADRIAVGQLVGVFGIKGWLKVKSNTEPAENIINYKPWFLKTQHGLKEIEIDDNEIVGSLHDKLMYLGGELVVKTVDLIESGAVHPTPQPESESKEAPKIFKNDCRVDWNKSAIEIDRLVRGMSPFPTAWSLLKNNKDEKETNVKLFSIEIVEEDHLAPGNIALVDKELFVGTKDFNVKLTDIQLEGKKRMSIKELINGFNFEEYSFSKI